MTIFMGKKLDRTERIGGIEVNFHVGKGVTIATASCPICGSSEDISTSQDHSPSIGQVVADRVNAHMKRSHPKEWANYAARNLPPN